ncbi:MAG: N-acetylmuramoyl-L-alanine amidase [Myxococcota bacterium]
MRCQPTPAALEHRCNGACGGTVQGRAEYRYCTGTSVGCGDANLQWTGWSDETTCGSNLCTQSGTAASCTPCALGCSGNQCVTQPTYVVCIDPGYGPGDTPASGGVNGYDVTWSVAQHLKAWLEADTAQPGGGGTWSVVLTRAADTTPTAAQRKATCDAAGATRVISIGVNGFNGTAHGSETYRKDTTDATWLAFANQVHAQVIAKGGLTDRGVKVGTFTILSTAAPSVWAFIGFLDNAGDRASLSNDGWRNGVAQGLMFALQQSLGYATFTP